jgi:hypothetical protein
MKTNKLTTKRFVIRKSLLGNNTVITFTNKKGYKFTYDHDEIYSTFQEKFESMPCFQQYKSYTNSNTVPKFCRELSEILDHQVSE